MMKIIDDFPMSPEENLAMDELFLVKAEKGELGETLRFWTNYEGFVVMGRSGKTDEECFVSKCREDGVKILRRFSGGGAVLQDRGCLNYSAILSYSRDEKYRKIDLSYESIMKGLAAGFSDKGQDVEFLPISDLAVSGRKFSGNAQARKRRYFLHHGTVLLDMDISKIGRYLKHPPKEPAYRVGRPHEDFVVNIELSREAVKDVILGVFAPDGVIWQPKTRDVEGLKELVEKKYSLDSWNFCF